MTFIAPKMKETFAMCLNIKHIRKKRNGEKANNKETHLRS